MKKEHKKEEKFKNNSIFEKIQKVFCMPLLQKWNIRKWIYGLVVLLSIYVSILYYREEIEVWTSFPGMRFSQANLQIQGGEIIRYSTAGHQAYGYFFDRKAQKTIVYFHGNGGPVEFFMSDIEYFLSLEYNVAVIEYPGYGKMPGLPNFEQMTQNSQDFYRALQNKKNLEEKNTIVVGYSIGSAVALEFAKTKTIDSLILISALSSSYDMSRAMFGWVPQKIIFLPNTYNSLQNISMLHAPVLLIHGNNDNLVPFEQGKKVFAQANRKKHFIELVGAGHNGVLYNGGKSLKYMIADFLKSQTLEEKYIYLDSDEKAKIEARHDIFSIDMNSDDSLTKFVDPKHSFVHPFYIPVELKNVTDSSYIIAEKGGMQLRKEALSALDSMGEAFYKEFGKKITLVSGYRSYTYQVGIKEGGCPDSLCANPGHSEHQSGLAVDIFEASTQQSFLANSDYKTYYDWLKTHAYLYGFHNTYQKGLGIDGYMVEPWHWRYVGVELASYLQKMDITLAEFYQENHF